MNKSNSKNILVVGGSGFMGSHTADELSKRGHNVTIFDQVHSPYLREDQSMIVGDMMNMSALEKAFKNTDYVYYLAGVADIAEAKKNPFDTIKKNVMGVTTALDAAIKQKIKRFIYASTMYVYSSSGSFYRASKQASEIIVKAYSDEHNLDFTFLRYGSLYGPRSQKWNGLHKYVNEIVQEGHLNYIGTGDERREYIHVLDASRLSADILSDRYVNKSVTITGLQVLDSSTLINMIFEIANVEYSATFSKINISDDHYKITPYRYQPDKAIKIVPDEFIDIGQGIMDLIEEIHHNLDT
jgi:UDP-glucose 4-epimerase